MKMGKIYFSILMAILFFAASCNDSINEDSTSEFGPSDNETLISKSGTIDGLSYSLEGVSVNPDLVIINSEKAKLQSCEKELSEGVIKLSLVSPETRSLLLVGNILYIHYSEGYTAMRRIEHISSDGNDYILETSQAQLGEVFQGGTIDISLDLYEASKVMEQRQMGTKAGFDNNYFYEIINLDGTYNWNGFNYTPATNIKMMLNAKMQFAKTQILPTQVSTIFELQTNINPSFQFGGSINKIYKDDFVKYVPQQVLDFIKAQEFDVDIPVNTLGIESLPVKVKVADLNIPMEMEVNLSKEFDLTYGYNGSLKIGYITNIKNFKATTTFVYENDIQATLPSISELHGEILTKYDIVITPDITVAGGSYTINGDITLSMETASNGHITLPGKTPIFGTRGTFTTAMNVNIDLLILKLPINLLNEETVLWEEGTIDKSITYSDLKWNVTSQNSTNVLSGTRSYKTDFTLNYKYPVLGKMIPNELLLSYDIYQTNGTTRLSQVKDVVIIPQNVTANSFGFSLDIPYKREGSILSSKYETVSYLKNIVIKDRKGYIYEGVYNTENNSIENNFMIKR